MQLYHNILIRFSLMYKCLLTINALKMAKPAYFRLVTYLLKKSTGYNKIFLPN